MTITNVVDQLNTQLAQKTEESPYYGPILKFPEGFSDADKARLTSEYRDMVENGLYPANARLRDFLRDSYLPLAREQVGLSAMKGGEGLYQYMIEQTTTLPLKADDIHNLGLSEVARITSGMEAIRKEVGFKGTLPEFFDHLRSDPKFKLASRDALTQGYYDIGKKVDGKHPPCGRSEADTKSYPKCRAAGVAGKMSDSEKKSACAQKRRAEKKDPKIGTGNKPTMTSYKPKK
jgi:uncharacterized protein (DUF885 family)